jgi:predicted XRE-type DNA-binding protein
MRRLRSLEKAELPQQEIIGVDDPRVEEVSKLGCEFFELQVTIT